MPIPKDPIECYFSNIETKPSGCVEWSGYKNRIGYGVFFCEGKRTAAHRTAYSLFIGPIPDGMSVLHSCDNPSCVNPNHLRAGTHKDNMEDRRKARRYFSKNRKVDNETALLIYRMKGSDTKISRETGVNRDCVRKIRRGILYQDVTNGVPSLEVRRKGDPIDDNGKEFVIKYPSGKTITVRNLRYWLKINGPLIWGEGFNWESARSGITKGGYKGFTAKRLDNQQT